MSSKTLVDRMNHIITSEPHPFSFGITRENVEQLMGEYLAMSKFFPYIQAAAHQQIAEQYLESGEDIPYSVEATSVVGAFLTWDEFGGHNKIILLGQKGLSKILQTKHFHANLLQSDIKKLFGENFKYKYSDKTRTYLNNLKKGLSSKNHLERIAYMIAFEMNAAVMIDALYTSLKNIFSQCGLLTYFEIHIGGEDPAEKYHVEMTTNLIESLVDPNEYDRYLQAFVASDQMNKHWCSAVKNI